MASVTADGIKERTSEAVYTDTANPLWQHATWPECRGWRNAQNVRQPCDQGDVAHHRAGRCRQCDRRNEAASDARSAVRGSRKEAATPERERAVPLAATLHPGEFGGEDAPHAPAAATLAESLLYDGAPKRADVQTVYTLTYVATGGATPPAPPVPPATTEVAAECDDFAWTLFEGAARTNDALRPTVSLGKDGDCRLNAGALALLPEGTAAVEVLFDRAKRALALRPCAATAPAGRMLRGDKTGAKVCSIRAFRKAHDWLPAGTLRLTPRLVGGLLVVVVNEVAK